MRDFRKNSRENCNLNELTYLHESFKVIKNTLKGLNFDYIAYDKNNMKLVDFNYDLLDKVNSELVGFRFNLPIKESDKRGRSSSAKTKKFSKSPDLLLKSKHKIS